MFSSPSLTTRITVGKLVGFIFGLIGLTCLPYLHPEAGWMIRTGGQADIVSIDAVDSDERPRFTPAVELGHALSRQGFKVNCIDTYSGDISVGDEILNRASDHGYDLVIMGCYGHSRLRETIFGGVTRELFSHMTAPVLMSHWSARKN